jgi:predicted nucleic acid-binding protein
MRPIPIFDTNVFVDAGQDLIASDRWRLLKRKCSRAGWALSAITAAELLVGVHRVPDEKFASVRKAVALAVDLRRDESCLSPGFWSANVS